MPDIDLGTTWVSRYCMSAKPFPVLYYEKETLDPRKTDEIPISATVSSGASCTPDAPKGYHDQLRLIEFERYVPIRGHCFAAKEYKDVIRRHDIKVDWECRAWYGSPKADSKSKKIKNREGKISMSKTKLPAAARPPGELSESQLHSMAHKAYRLDMIVLYFENPILGDDFLNADPYVIRPKACTVAALAKHAGKEPVKIGLYIDGSKKTPKYVPVRGHVFPYDCTPRFRKYTDDRKCLETMGMAKSRPNGKTLVDRVENRAVQKNAIGEFSKDLVDKYQALSKRQRNITGEPSVRFTEPIVKSQTMKKTAKSQKKPAELSRAHAALKEKQLREAYEERARVNAEMNGYNPRSDPFRSEKMAIRANTRMLEQMLVAADEHSRGIVMETLEKNEARLEEIAEIKRRDRKSHAKELQRLETIRERIEWIRKNGPDLQSSFLEEEDEPVDGKTAAAGK